jgi:hypothetical protein
MSLAVRGIRVGLATLLFVLAAPVRADAKPPFTVEWSPRTPSAGEAVRVTVRFWDDAENTELARWPSVRTLNDFLWVSRGSSAPEDAIPVDLALVRPGVYRGRIILASDGAWFLCPWVRSCAVGEEDPGDLGRLTLLVVPPSTPARSDADPPAEGAVGRSGAAPAATAGAVAIVLVAAGTLGVRGLRRAEAARRAGPPR